MQRSKRAMTESSIPANQRALRQATSSHVHASRTSAELRYRNAAKCGDKIRPGRPVHHPHGRCCLETLARLGSIFDVDRFPKLHTNA